MLAGSELLTGNMALVPVAMLRKRVGMKALSLNFSIVTIGNLIGSLFVAYFLAAEDTGGKILGIFFRARPLRPGREHRAWDHT